MTIEDRVRQVLHEAVAVEPPPRGAPLDAVIGRRRRRRPVPAGAAALVLVLAAVAGLAAVRGRERPPPTAVPTDGWATYTNQAENLRFRYPPGWRLESLRGPELLRLVPPEQAAVPDRQRTLRVYLDAGRGFWVGEDWFGTASRGRLPGGQAYLRTSTLPIGTGGREPTSAAADRHRDAQWSVDWGRACLTEAPRCASRSVRVSLFAADPELFDRHEPTVEALVATLEQLRPTAPSTGDRGLPACRPHQWRLVWPEEYGGARGVQGIAVQGGVQYLEGPRCHLRLTVRMAVQDGNGRLLPVAGNPASTSFEGDLPIDGLPREDGSWVIGRTPMWRFIWEEWCNRGLPQATLRVSADGGAGVTVPGFDPAAPRDSFAGGCRDRGRPSVVAAWP
jgi:hypothetical protein